MKKKTAFLILSFLIFFGLVYVGSFHFLQSKDKTTSGTQQNVLQDAQNPMTVVLTKGGSPGSEPPPVCTREPVDVILTIDDSNSMNQGRLDAAKEAFYSFHSILKENQGSRIGLATFNHHGGMELGLSDTYNDQEIRAAIDDLDLQGEGGGGTCLECALDNPNNADDIYGEFQRARERDPEKFNGQRQVVIVLTDGRFNHYFNGKEKIVGDAGNEKQLEITRQKTEAAIRRVSEEYNAEFWFVQFAGRTGTSKPPYYNEEYLREMVAMANEISGGEGQYYKAVDLQGENSFEIIYNDIALLLRGGAPINGFVYHDANGNGTPQGSEPMLNGTEVRLKEQGRINTSIDYTGPPPSSSPDGFFSFSRICGRDYDLSAIPPPGYVFGHIVGPVNTSPVPFTGSVEIRNKKAYDINTIYIGLEKITDDQDYGSISGCVFKDNDKDRKRNIASGDEDLPDIGTKLSGGVTTVSSSGCYQFNNLSPGEYSVSLINVPTEYSIAFPWLFGEYAPYSATVSLTNSCAVVPDNGPQACTNGNLTNVDFALWSSVPSPGGTSWMQVYGLDVRFENGIRNEIPDTASLACKGSHMLVPSSSDTPGVLFTGEKNADFGEGSASSPNWKVGGFLNPDPLSVSMKNGSAVSYEKIMQKLQKNNTPYANLPASCSGPSGCILPANLQSGIYHADRSVRIRGFAPQGGSTYLFLINGNLTIDGQVRMPTGIAIVYIAKGDIAVTSSVGRAASCTETSQVDGFFVSGNNFKINSSASCPSSSDLQLVMQGGIAVNASRKRGNFTNNRTLCANDGTFPSFMLIERPDSFLTMPDILSNENFIWQELAP